MYSIIEPGPENNYQSEHVDLLIESYRHWTNKDLVKIQYPEESIYYNLYYAPYGVVSHNTDNSPVFNYGNQTALRLFEMSWDSFIKLESKKSAEPVNRDERERLLSQVKEHGYIDNYQGIRISSSGKRFVIENALVWNLIDHRGDYHGQAALFSNWTELPRDT